MIKSASDILAGISGEVRTYPKKRRSRNLPVMVCLNWERGCVGRTKEPGSGNGLCKRCYQRKRRYGDSWHHAPNLRQCRRRDCFMKGTEGHP